MAGSPAHDQWHRAHRGRGEGSSTQFKGTLSQQGHLKGVTGVFVPLPNAKVQRQLNSEVFPWAVPPLWLW